MSAESEPFLLIIYFPKEKDKSLNSYKERIVVVCINFNSEMRNDLINPFSLYEGI